MKQMMEGSGHNAPIVGITTMSTRGAGVAGVAPLRRRHVTFAAFRGTTPVTVHTGQRWVALVIAADLLAEVVHIPVVPAGRLLLPGRPHGEVVVESRRIWLCWRRPMRMSMQWKGTATLGRQRLST